MTTETPYVTLLFQRAAANLAAAEKAKEPPPVQVQEPEPKVEPAPSFTEGTVYRDPVTGVRKRYQGGQFV